MQTIIVSIIHRKNKWAIKKHSKSRASKLFYSKKSAIKFAKKFADKIFVHNENGSVDDLITADGKQL